LLIDITRSGLSYMLNVTPVADDGSVILSLMIITMSKTQTQYAFKIAKAVEVKGALDQIEKIKDNNAAFFKSRLFTVQSTLMEEILWVNERIRQATKEQ
jgi:hypothetical protein